MIKATTVYETMGKQFRHHDQAIDYREGLIEEFFRKSPGFDTISAKKRLEFIQYIIDSRDHLRNLLEWETRLPDADEC